MCSKQKWTCVERCLPRREPGNGKKEPNDRDAIKSNRLLGGWCPSYRGLRLEKIVKMSWSAKRQFEYRAYRSELAIDTRHIGGKGYNAREFYNLVHYYCFAKIILQQTITFILTILDLHQIFRLIVTKQTMENFLLNIKEHKYME